MLPVLVPIVVALLEIPAELVEIPVLAPVETVWIPAELVAIPVAAPVDTV